MSKKCRINAFTLMELLVVVISLSIMAGFAIPSYTKAVERAYEKDGVNNLILLSGAQEAYLAKNGDYWPGFTNACGGGNCGIAGGLNTALKVNITENGMQYICSRSAGPGTYGCFAIRQGGNNFQLYINWTMAPNPPNVPCCDKNSGITCPTVPICP